MSKITKSHIWPTKYGVSHTKITGKLRRFQIRRNFFDISNYMKLLFFVPSSFSTGATRLETWRVASRSLDFVSGTGRKYFLLPLDGVIIQCYPDTSKYLDLCVHGHLAILEFVLHELQA